MRVLQLVTTEAPFFQKQIEALERHGVSCTTVSLPSRNGESRPLREYAAFYRQILERTRGDYDLVHANYGLVGPLALAQPRRPLVLTLWGSDVMGAADWLDTVSGFAARHSDAVVAPAPAVSDRLDCDHYLVPFGVDTDLFRPIPKSTARERLGWDPEERTVLFPYPPDREIKNYPLAEQVVARVPGETALKTMSGVPYESVPLYMNASDAVLVTSKRESGPMVVKEATACRVPVVSTDVGFAADVLEGVESSTVGTGIDELVDGLVTALDDETKPIRRAHVDGFGLDRMGEALLTVYRDALGRTTGGPHVRV